MTRIGGALVKVRRACRIARVGVVMRRMAAVVALLATLTGQAAAQEPDVPLLFPEGSAIQAEPGERWWARLSYLLWWIKDGPSPGPLITTGPADDPDRGVLGDPDTTVIFGGPGFDYRNNSGFYLTVGGWLGPAQAVAFEVAGFMLETHTIHGEANSDPEDGSPVIARPFFNVLTGAEDAYVITAPGELLGGIDIFSDSRFWGAEANVVFGELHRGGGLRAELLAGFRYLGLKDELRFDQASTHLPGGTISFLGVPVLNADIISVRDLLHSHDQFYGGQFGLRGELRRGIWFASAAGKAGIGGTVQEAIMVGRTLRTSSDGRSVEAVGGLFTQRSNYGYRARGEFSFVSEGSARLGCQLTERLALQLGYMIIYWSSVARPGAQINRAINPSQVPSSPLFGTQPEPIQPARFFRATDFWGQGLDLGLEVRF